MSHYAHGESRAALTGWWSIPWRTLFRRATNTLRLWAARQRQRHELLEYLATDHRVVADIGASENDMREWATRPFWQA